MFLLIVRGKVTKTVHVHEPQLLKRGEPKRNGTEVVVGLFVVLCCFFGFVVVVVCLVFCCCFLLLLLLLLLLCVCGFVAVVGICVVLGLFAF